MYNWTFILTDKEKWQKQLFSSERFYPFVNYMGWNGMQG